jgi:hypothetical protein
VLEEGLSAGKPTRGKVNPVEIPGVGPLSLDEDVGWYFSTPMAAGALRGTVGEIVIAQEDLLDHDASPFGDAAVTFLTADDGALREASPHVFAYYLDARRRVGELGLDLQLPDIAEPESVWDHVSFGTEFHLEHGRGPDAPVFVSVECSCAWEQEHGLQLVFREGRTVTKVGPFDGHLTNRAAFNRMDLEGTVYVSRFDL